jgi:hypothetical protein
MADPLAPEEAGNDTRLTEAILDNLSGWTVVALLIGLLYLVWATLEIMSRYIGGLPSVGA